MKEENKTLKDFNFKGGTSKVGDLVLKSELKQEAIKWVKSKSKIIKPVFGEEGLLWAIMPQNEMWIDDVFNISELKGAITEKIRFYNITEEELK
ncbi:MAG: hypothetical protein ACTSPI_01345 [Candidatus Heimdallarchaeaceae archaeon]